MEVNNGFRYHRLDKIFETDGGIEDCQDGYVLKETGLSESFENTQFRMFLSKQLTPLCEKHFSRVFKTNKFGDKVEDIMTDQQPFEGYTKKIKSLHLTRIIKQSGVLFTNAHDVINVGKETKYQNLEGEWEVDFDVFLFKKVLALFLWTRGIEII